MAGGGIILSTRESIRLGLLDDFRTGKRTRSEVAVLLGITERSVSRIVKKLRDKGPLGVKHGNYGKLPVNKRSQSEREAALELVRTKYRDFNLAHCFEYLVRDHGISCCYDTFRKWCRLAGLGKHRKRRASKARLMRERMSGEGIMLQMDGSHHKWNGKDEWCLIAGIDDATSTMPGAKFFPGETTWGCFTVLRSIIERFGIPEILYTDCAGWAGGGEKRRHFSQFVRACEELGIRLITTSSPESKGRIERAFRTLQDRLIPELALASITTMTDANRYLEQVFLPTYWNARLTVVPRDNKPKYRPLAPHQDLGEILCFKQWRKVNRDHTVSLDAAIYQLYPEDIGSIRGKEVIAHIQQDGHVEWYYGHRRIRSERKKKAARYGIGREAS